MGTRTASPPVPSSTLVMDSVVPSKLGELSAAWAGVNTAGVTKTEIAGSEPEFCAESCLVIMDEFLYDIADEIC